MLNSSADPRRGALGVCPQVNAIDPHLTGTSLSASSSLSSKLTPVRQHLWVYGRLKGVPSSALKRDIGVLLAGAGLSGKADEFANSLSGGNQRKLSLALALLGDRPVVLIDEFSSGVDPFSKREAWSTLRALTRERAVLMTTHSMEEVDALADRVGIIASRLLGESRRPGGALFGSCLAPGASDVSLRLGPRPSDSILPDTADNSRRHPLRAQGTLRDVRGACVCGGRGARAGVAADERIRARPPLAGHEHAPQRATRWRGGACVAARGAERSRRAVDDPRVSPCSVSMSRFGCRTFESV